MKRTAEIRTAQQFAGWDLVRTKKHNASMVETPAAWIFRKIKGIWYPYEIA